MEQKAFDVNKHISVILNCMFDIENTRSQRIKRILYFNLRNRKKMTRRDNKK